MKRKKAVKVTLRFRLLESGKETLYLDFYPPIIDLSTKKETRREYLGMYVFPLKDRSGNLKINHSGNYKYSQTDMETIRLAEIICNNRQNELDKANIYTTSEKEMLDAIERSKGDFIQFFQKIADEKKTSNHDNWLSTLKHLKNYTKRTEKCDIIRFCDINLQWCESFKDYLLKTKSYRSDKTQLANNTAAAYFIKFKIALKAAYKYGYLPKDVNSDLKSIKQKETQRNYLSFEEVKRLVVTPCTNEVLKRAALFSILTGLRFSDIVKMKWNEIILVENNDYTLKYLVQKTQIFIESPISNDAVFLCGDRQAPDELVFKGLKYSAYSNKALAQWIGAAGITRHITFHMGRHTCATLQSASGTQIPIIQKMLAHQRIQTTMIYVKTLEEQEREAANKIKLFNNDEQ